MKVKTDPGVYKLSALVLSLSHTHRKTRARTHAHTHFRLTKHIMNVTTCMLARVVLMRWILELKLVLIKQDECFLLMKATNRFLYVSINLMKCLWMIALDVPVGWVKCVNQSSMMLEETHPRQQAESRWWGPALLPHLTQFVLTQRQKTHTDLKVQTHSDSSVCACGYVHVSVCVSVCVEIRAKDQSLCCRDQDRGASPPLSTGHHAESSQTWWGRKAEGVSFKIKVPKRGGKVLRKQTQPQPTEEHVAASTRCSEQPSKQVRWKSLHSVCGRSWKGGHMKFGFSTRGGSTRQTHFLLGPEALEIAQIANRSRPLQAMMEKWTSA